jgi:hypothetical protein
VVSVLPQVTYASLGLDPMDTVPMGPEPRVQGNIHEAHGLQLTCHQPHCPFLKQKPPLFPISPAHIPRPRLWDPPGSSHVISANVEDDRLPFNLQNPPLQL